MNRPPALARAIERGLDPFRGKHASHLLPKTRLGGPIPWVIAIMVALTVLTAGGGLALDNLANRARADLSGGVTVQIVEADPRLRTAQADRVADLLRAAPGVASLRRVPERELEALVEPWLGSGLDEEIVPLPALIDVRLDGPATPAAIGRLRAALAGAASEARIDAQSDWLGPVFDTVSALRLMSFGLIALLAFTGAAAVWLAARNALNANRDTIEIVHLLGGDDAQIARIFQRSVMVDAAVGGVCGLVLGGAAIALLGAQFAALESGMVARGGLAPADWLLLALVPLAMIGIALLTARMTVMASLRRML